MTHAGTYTDGQLLEVLEDGDLRFSATLHEKQEYGPDEREVKTSLRHWIRHRALYADHPGHYEVWAAADGFGDMTPEEYEYDPSGPRDSSPGAKVEMYRAALNVISRADMCAALGIDDPCPEADAEFFADAPAPETPGQGFVVTFRGDETWMEEVPPKNGPDPRR